MNRAERRAAARQCRQERQHLFKSEFTYCVRCGALKEKS